jgi:hypothetical protein
MQIQAIHHFQAMVFHSLWAQIENRSDLLRILAFGDEFEDFPLPGIQLFERATLVDDWIGYAARGLHGDSPKLIRHKMQGRFGLLRSRHSQFRSCLSQFRSRFSPLGASLGLLGARFSSFGSHLGLLGARLRLLGSRLRLFGSHFGLLGSRFGLLGSRLSLFGPSLG